MPDFTGWNGGVGGTIRFQGNLVDPGIFTPGGYPLATANYGFGSEAVNLEYSIQSNMLSAAFPESIF